MRGKGINYDTGFSPGGHSSREHFDAGVVRAEMRVIARELRCTAVRISGGDPGRLSTAGEGLEVWFAPFPCELTTDQLAPLFADCADRAGTRASAGSPSSRSPRWPGRTGGRHRLRAATPDNPAPPRRESRFGPGPAGANPLPRLDMLLRFALP
jgi:hypothetical protein